MFDEMVLYHSILIETLLGLFIISLAILYIGDSYQKAVKRLRVYMFFFHALVTGVAFSGLVAFVFAKIDFNLGIFAMIALYIAVSTIESIKYIKTLKSDNLKDVKSISIRYTAVNIILVVSMVVWKVVEKSSAVSIS
jgi:hypothetical protein